MAAKHKPARKKRTAPRRKSRPRKRLKSKGRWWLPVVVVFVLAAVGGGYWFVSSRDSLPRLELPALWRTDQTPQSVSFKVFFGNAEKDPDSEDCKVVYPVDRSVDGTLAVARIAVEELLKGPTKEEQGKGYYTSINPGVRILHLLVSDGEAVLDLSREIETGVAGSCQVEAIWSQLERTLTQFETVERLSLTVQGKASNALQP